MQPLDDQSSPTSAVDARGRVHTGGVQRCASPWFCHLCTFTIGERRAAEVDETVTAHFASGGHAYMVSLTLRHRAGEDLAPMLGDLIVAGTKTVSGRRWDGLKEIRSFSWTPGVYDALRARKPDRSLVPTLRPGPKKPLRDRHGHVLHGPQEPTLRYPLSDRPTLGPPLPRKDYQASEAVPGVVGQIKTVEITDGEHGWHPHLHMLVFLSGQRTADTQRIVTEHFQSQWPHHLRRLGRDATVAHGVDVRPVVPVDQDGGKSIGRYLNKVQGGWGVGLEMAGSHLKAARRGGAGPFELARLAFVERDKRALARCIEYEAATAGKAKLTWSPRLRALYGLADEMTDSEAAIEEMATPPVVVATWTPDEWGFLRSEWRVGPMLDSLRTCAAIASAWGAVTYRGETRPAGAVRMPQRWLRMWTDPPDESEWALAA
jgi:hypothetical protein